MSEHPRLPLARIGLWTGALDTVPATRARELAAELEELGYGALWIPEVAGRDPFVHLALLLLATVVTLACGVALAAALQRTAAPVAAIRRGIE